ncbi:MAG: peptidoglycan-associated lipoprotein [Rhodospirillaceae bacterium TMED8]|nr:peptidoglycan-associated lipoprotein [Magnetovibrio sp.]OUT50219.1 MAG: peptidoglycan-associated lipoprotein [Rhodospirillaceae bacterium TMED8]
MRLKFFGILAAVALVSACETASEESGAKSSGGATSSAASAAQTSAPAVQGIKAGSQQDLVVNVGDRVFFDYDSYAVRTNQQNTLDKQIVWMKSNPSVSVQIEGHADERGTREYNLALGERRANAVKDYLAAGGVNPSRIKTISYGKERPVALGSNEEAWLQNRRGVTRVVSAGS